MAALSRTQRLQAVSAPGAWEETWLMVIEIAREIRPRAARGVEHTSLAESTFQRYFGIEPRAMHR